MDRKKPSVNLRNYYNIFLQVGMIIVLVIFIAAVKVDFVSEKQAVDLTDNQEVVKMEEVIQTRQQESPPPPPKPQVPVEVPNDEIIEDQNIELSADLNMGDKLEMPDPPAEEDKEEEFFVAVEQMPKMKGGQKWLYNQLDEYPERARKAGIEGRVVLQFVVNKKGQVHDISVIRGIGGGCDVAAKRVLKKAEFVPGRQRGKPVPVQMSIAVNFELTQ